MYGVVYEIREEFQICIPIERPLCVAKQKRFEPEGRGKHFHLPEYEGKEFLYEAEIFFVIFGIFDDEVAYLTVPIPDLFSGCVFPFRNEGHDHLLNGLRCEEFPEREIEQEYSGKVSSERIRGWCGGNRQPLEHSKHFLVYSFGMAGGFRHCKQPRGLFYAFKRPLHCSDRFQHPAAAGVAHDRF